MQNGGFMNPSIPRPLVRLNQTFIAFNGLAYLLFHQQVFLVLPLMVCFSSVFFNFNPIIKWGKFFLRKPLNEYHQEDKAQQQFNQMLAMSMFVAAYFSWFMGWTFASYIFATMVFLASTIALFGFCIGCFIQFQYKMYKYRRAALKADYE